MIRLFNDRDYNLVRSIITKTIEKKLGFWINDLSQYHHYVNNEQHNLFKNKLSRILNEEDANSILSLSSVVAMLNKLGEYKITDVKLPDGTFQNRPEVYFRIVRPKSISDVGQLHCDAWFDQLYGIDYGGKPALKSWTLLWGNWDNPGLEFFNVNSNAIDKWDIVENVDGTKKFNCRIKKL